MEGRRKAKGRVERTNGTPQDRSVKEMRLRGIDGMEAATSYLTEFMEDHNQRCATAKTLTARPSGGHIELY